MRRFLWRLAGMYTLLRLATAFFAGGWTRRGALLRTVPWMLNHLLARQPRLRRLLDAVAKLAMTRMRAQRM
jgi:hypothetical protein